MVHRRLILAALLLCWVTAFGCRNPAPKKLLECKVIESNSEMIGGPGSVAQIGDYICRNDQIQFVITRASHSWGPGIFGGSLVDVDLRRVDSRFRTGRGSDQFMEAFPLANLVVPNSDRMKITIVNDGSNEVETRIRVESDGAFIFAFLGDLLNNPLVQNLVKGIMVNFGIRTDYILKPGARHIVMETTLYLPASKKTECTATCPTTCDGGCTVDEKGCSTTECSEPLMMEPLTEPAPVFDRITGDIPGLVGEPGGRRKPGVLAGDFLFFGGQNNIFAPGVGFDENKEIWEGFFRGVSSLTRPLTFDFVAATGKYVSYGMVAKHETKFDGTCTSRLVLGYLAPKDRAAVKTILVSTGLSETDADKALDELLLGKIPIRLATGLNDGDLATKTAEFNQKLAGADFRLRGEPEGRCAPPTMQFPLFTTSATATLSAGINCSRDKDDDTTCDVKRSFFYRRYFVVGDGDVGSVYDEMLKIRGSDVGEIAGVVRNSSTGEPVTNADVFVIKNPIPTKKWTSYEELIAENKKALGTPGILNQFRTDVGTDRVKNGDYHGNLLPGHYVVMARHNGVRSPLYPIEIVANGVLRVNPIIPPAARLQYRVTNSQGMLIPAKILLVSVDADKKPLFFDGKRLVALGDGRFNNGIRYKLFTHTGKGTVNIEPGRYRAYVSHGIEYSISIKDFEVEHGGYVKLFTHLQHEIDTKGWVSADFHVHHRDSFDSGLDKKTRIQTFLAEGVDIITATDHDIVTDFGPTIREMKMEHQIRSIVGVELSTLELGHFLGFPMRYEPNLLPGHGMIDWVGMDAPEVMQSLFSMGKYGKEHTVVGVPHPRDGFNGYFDQIGLSSYSLISKPAGLQENNPCLVRTSCNFNVIEILNEKRFELILNPTVGEINDYNRALLKIEAAKSPDEISMCVGKDYTLEECKDRARRELNLVSVQQMLVRTPEESAAYWKHVTETPEEQTKCTSSDIKGPRLSDEERIKPCTQHEGQLDDWFNLLNHGMNPTALGNSDSHGLKFEGGFPRNYIISSTDKPRLVDEKKLMASVIARKVVTTTGPFVEFSIDNTEVGGTVIPKGDTIRLRLKVQTASWIASNRVEIYQNGKVVKVLTKDNPKSTIVDFDETIDLPKPDRDAWFVVTVIGTGRNNTMQPIYQSPPFGQLQIPKLIELTGATFAPLALFLGEAAPSIPDFFPMIPYALTNPIWVDVDGDGFQPLFPDKPAFCPKKCTLPAKDSDGKRPKEQQECPKDMVCIEGIDGNGVCGHDIEGKCIFDPIDSSPPTINLTDQQTQTLRQGLRPQVKQRYQTYRRFYRKTRSRSLRILKHLSGVPH